jgi:uroporphyrinogen decarboxylase
MNGRQRVAAVVAGQPVDRPPVMPILHSGYATALEVPLGGFYTSAAVMADVMVRGCRMFNFDGVQLSMGVTGEAEALGAAIQQPPDGAPLLRQSLLADLGNLSHLRTLDPTVGGRMPMFYEAVERTVSATRGETYVLATLRGPLLAASQLRGVQEILMDLLDQPDEAERILEFTQETALRLGRWLLGSGAHGLVLGEATCSPNFISPRFYRQFVLPRHRELVRGLKAAGWQAVGLHICGDTTPIIEDIVSTGVDFLDIDYQVPAARAIGLARNRIALRGNLDPSADFRFGQPAEIQAKTQTLLQDVQGARWIMSSGCDIPPGTPAENMAAFAAATTEVTER